MNSDEWFKSLQMMSEVSPFDSFDYSSYVQCPCGAKFYGGKHTEWAAEHFKHVKPVTVYVPNDQEIAKGGKIRVWTI